MPNDTKPKTKTRRFVIWAEVRFAEHTLEMSSDATDEECEAACQEALDTLIGNGDTGWAELGKDEGV